jgi:hypothetical protein
MSIMADNATNNDMLTKVYMLTSSLDCSTLLMLGIALRSSVMNMELSLLLRPLACAVCGTRCSLLQFRLVTMSSQIFSLTILQILEALGAITAAKAKAAVREYQADAQATNQDVAGNGAAEDLSKKC